MARTAIRGAGSNGRVRRLAATLVVGLLGAAGVTATPASADTLGASQLVAGSTLSGVACPTATTCEAVGTVEAYTGSTTGAVGPGLIVPITNGVPGTAQTVAGTHSLSAIACPTATSCVAIGTNNSSGAVVVSITLGATDTFGTPTTVSGIQQWYSSADGNGIACPTATECEAVAQGTSGPVVVPITNGTPGTPEGVAGTLYLNGIACPSATTCEAVGEIDVNSSGVGAIVPITNGVPGALQQVPGIENLTGIACPSASNCEAAGNTSPYAQVSTDQAVSIDLGATDAFGPVWPVQVVDGAPAVACATSTSCAVVDTNVQVNNGFITNGTETPLTDGFPGQTQAAPGTAELVGAACPTAATCIGVGSQTISLGGSSTGLEGAVTQIGVTTPTAVSNLTFTPSNSGASVSNVTYTFSFTATSGLPAGSSSIDLAAPAGTVFPAYRGCGTYFVTDITTGVAAGSCSGGQPSVTASGGGGNGVVVTNPLSVAAGDTVTVVVNGVANSASVGSANVGLATSSDPIPMSTTFAVQQSYSVAGQITFASGTPPTSAPVSGALVEACAAVGNFCTEAFATTDASGNYSLLLPSGTYLLTASPPAGASEMSQTTGTPFTVGTQAQSGVNLTLSAMQTLLAGETINSPNFGLQTSSSATPSITWSSPSTIHIPASLFPPLPPTGPTTVVTDLQVTGTNTQTGLADTVTVNLGAQATIASGAAQGLTGSSGLIVGPSGIDITVPPVAPIHGPVTLSLATYTVAAGLNVPTGVALAGPNPVVFTNGAPDQPAPLVATDFGVDHLIGAPTIVGPDSAAFSVDSAVDDPLQGDTSTPNCLPHTTISQNVPAVPGATSSCDISVDWSQPAIPNTNGVYTATMEVPVTNSAGQPATLPIPLIACPGISSATVCSSLAAIAAAIAPTVTAVSPNNGPPDGGTPITITGTGFIGATAADIGAGNACASAFTVVNATSITCNTPSGLGTVDVTVTTPQGTSAANPPDDYFTYVPSGGSTTPTPPATPAVTTPIFSLYVDPSGTVQATATDGSTVPVSGATVTLSRQDPTSLSYTAVPNGSAIMSASNRTNPQTTGATGTFGWDTLAGTYEISASMAGCTPTPVTSPPETVPPPATGLVLTLSCPNLILAPTTTTLSTSTGPFTAGQPVTFTAGVTGSASPTGTVSIDDGATVLAVVPLDASTTSVNFSTASLPPGPHTITANYSGDAANAPSTSSSVPLELSAPQLATQTITFTSTPPSPAAVGSTYTPTATRGTSANPVTFSAAPASAGICTVTASTVNFIGAGTCLIDANQAGDANDLAAPQVQQTTIVFTNEAAPTVTGVSPNNGPPAGGTAITIAGTGFIGATAADIGAGNACASAFTVVNATSITCNTPSGSGTVDVTVTTPQGTSAANPTGDYFTYTGGGGGPQPPATVFAAATASTTTTPAPTPTPTPAPTTSSSGGSPTKPKVPAASPATVKTTPGSVVTVIGKDTSLKKATAVTITITEPGQKARTASTTVNSNNEILYKTPALPTGTTNVVFAVKGKTIKTTSVEAIIPVSPSPLSATSGKTATIIGASSAKVGTAVTVKVAEPKQTLIQSSTKVNGYGEIIFTTGALPTGATTVSFIVSGKTVKTTTINAKAVAKKKK